MAWTLKEKTQFAQLLVALGETMNEPVSELRTEMYHALLDDLPFDTVRVAAHQYALRGRFFPKPADLREIVLGTPEDQAEIAWAYVRREVRRVGWIGTPNWPDEATRRAAMELFGGWRALCENLAESGPEMLGTAKLFKSSFAALARRDAGQAVALPPSREEAQARLADLKTELEQRALPTKGLD